MTAPTPAVLTSQTTYTDDVRRWSSYEPWKGLPSLKHKTSFTAADVGTDGSGNVTAMPVLLHKPCFGRPEVFLRHGLTTKKFKTRSGDVVDALSRCDRCAAVGVRSACESVSLERVAADQTISAALDEWSEQTELHPTAPAYTGPIGRYWTAFREAVAARGPFQSVNDVVVAAHEASLDESRRKAARIKKRNQRQTRRTLGQKPSRDFIAAALAERTRRVAVLITLAGSPDAPRWVAKLQPRGCEITGDVWLGGLLLRQMDRRASAADIGRWLARNGRTHGVARDTLRTRIYVDLERIKQIEASDHGPAIWAAFDPDA